MSEMKEKIIIDTDIGDDIDDALAISLAVKSPEIDLIGVTTVWKDTAARARLAKSVLRMLGRGDIPVYIGCAQPLIGKVDDQEIPNQYSADMDFITVNTDMDAADYIIDTVMKSEGDISLVTIGALTNIALAIVKKPEIKNRIKRIVMMGGAYYFHYNEYNIECDPEAARIVFESGIPIKAVGLDVTLQCQLTKEDVERIEHPHSEITKFLSELIGRWTKINNYLPILHDPLAVCAVFDKELLEFKEERIVIETKGEFTRGATHNQTSYRWGNTDPVNSNIWTAKNVDHEKFTKLFMDRVFG
ncbi:nucleoside hydrolase [Neobacillus sp. NPDC093127]|uniref:nucleoside hydrolase n=1 Tax=Neobacillus sp. NPDC093127 TaxID=3364296 RepID=UPI003822C361